MTQQNHLDWLGLFTSRTVRGPSLGSGGNQTQSFHCLVDVFQSSSFKSLACHMSLGGWPAVKGGCSWAVYNFDPLFIIGNNCFRSFSQDRTSCLNPLKGTRICDTLLLVIFSHPIEVPCGKFWAARDWLGWGSLPWATSVTFGLQTQVFNHLATALLLSLRVLPRPSFSCLCWFCAVYLPSFSYVIQSVITECPEQVKWAHTWCVGFVALVHTVLGHLAHLCSSCSLVGAYYYYFYISEINQNYIRNQHSEFRPLTSYALLVFSVSIKKKKMFGTYPTSFICVWTGPDALFLQVKKIIKTLWKTLLAWIELLEKPVRSSSGNLFCGICTEYTTCAKKDCAQHVVLSQSIIVLFWSVFSSVQCEVSGEVMRV